MYFYVAYLLTLALNPTPLSQIDPPNLAPCERLAIVATTAKQAATTTPVAGARSGSSNLWSDDGDELNTSPLSAREDPIASVMAVRCDMR